MSPPCTLCEPFHPKKLHHEDEDHLQHHQQAQTRLAALPSCAEDAKETLRLRLRGHIKATLKAHLHRSQPSHTAQEHHLVTVPCTESEFGTLFSGLPFTFHKGHYNPRPWRNLCSGNPESHTRTCLGHSRGARPPHLLCGHPCERNGVLCAPVLLCRGLNLHRENQGLLF